MPEKRGTKGVYEKSPGSGVWWIRYANAYGRIVREKVGTKANAARLYLNRKSAVLEGRKLPNRIRAVVMFAELADDTLEYSKAHKLSSVDDVCRMQVILEWFGSKPAESITPQDIDRKLTQAAKARKWRPATSNRYKALLSLAYRLGVQNGKVSANPARLVRPTREDNARIRFLSPDEEKRLYATVEAEYPDRLPELTIALYTGMRAGEQFGLKWENVDFANRIVSIPRSKHGGTRHVNLCERAFLAFEELRQSRSGAGLVFCDKDGNPHRNGKRWFEKCVARSGITEFTWHCLRHTFASRMMMSGENIRVVQDAMGHLTIGMTVRYAHLAPEVGRRAVQRMEQWAENQMSEATDTRTDTSVRTGEIASTARVM
jgi:integrase